MLDLPYLKTSLNCNVCRSRQFEADKVFILYFQGGIPTPKGKIVVENKGCRAHDKKASQPHMFVCKINVLVIYNKS